VIHLRFTASGLIDTARKLKVIAKGKWSEKFISPIFRLVLGTTNCYSMNAATTVKECQRQASTGWQCNHVIGSVPDEHLVHKQAQLVLYSLYDRQPMQLPQSRSDMVAKL